MAAEPAPPPCKAEKLEALLVHLCQVEFQLDESVWRNAFRLFRDTKHHIETGSGREEDFAKCWIASILYCAFKLSRHTTSVQAKGFTLTKLLTKLNFSILDFFKELTCFLHKADPVLRSIFGEACNNFNEQIRQLQANYVHLAVLYDNYEKNFFRFFAPSEKFLEAASTTNVGGGVDMSCYLRFGWMLFISLRMHCPDQFVDLMTCANGLIAIFVIMIIHMPAHLRKVSLEDTSTYAVYSSRGVNITASLCHLYDASEEDVRTMLGKVTSLIQLLIEPNQKSSLPSEPQQTSGIDTDGLLYFEGLMEGSSMCSCTEVLDKKYTEMYYKQGEIDERALLPNKKSSNEMPVVDYSPNCAKRKHEMIISPSKPLALRACASARCGSPSPSSTRVTSHHRLPPPTPVSASMSSAKWLRSVVVPLPAEPSPSLLLFFKSCDTNVIQEVSYRAHVLLESVFCVEAIRNAAIGELKEIPSLISDWASQRRLEALKLYYKVLGTMCEAEDQRFKNHNLSGLLVNDNFHRCMLACSAEVVLATYATVSIAFPAVLDRMGITAFDLNKVIENFVRHEGTLPRELKRHLNSIEERLLEMLAWAKGSSMYNSLIIAEPHLKSEICQLGLLAEPMPSLELLKSQRSLPLTSRKTTSYALSWLNDLDHNGSDRTVCADEVHGLQLPSTSASIFPIREDVTVATAHVSPIVSSPMEVQSSAFSSLTASDALAQLPWHSAFASPQKQNLGGGETSAETSISVFFQKVLKLAAIRIKLFSEALNKPIHLMEEIYKLFEQLLHRETHLFFDRHIDQIILCCLFGVCKVEKGKMTFREIVQSYRQLPQHRPHVFRAVLLDPRGGVEARGDIIRFYNDIFISSAKGYLIQLSTRLIAKSGNDRAEGKT